MTVADRANGGGALLLGRREPRTSHDIFRPHMKFLMVARLPFYPLITRATDLPKVLSDGLKVGRYGALPLIQQ